MNFKPVFQPRPYFFFLLFLLLLSCQRVKQPLGPDDNSAAAWRISDPAAQGLNSQILAQAYSQAATLGFVDALLVERNQVLVAEMYLNGYSRQKSHIIHSVSKSILSAMIGMAVEQRLFTLQDPVLNLLVDDDVIISDERKKQISVYHLLTMTPGFDGDRALYFTVANSSNWVQKTLNLPLKYAPGEKFSYFTFNSHLLSAILTAASGMTSLQFGERYLFSPAGISCTAWDRDPQGIYFGGNNMYFVPRDLVRFGRLYLNRGQLDGQRIVPQSWVDQSVATAYGGNSQWGVLKNVGYGYQWWTGNLAGYNVFFALGHGGQYIMIVPALQMVIVTTANPPYGANLWDVADEQERAVLAVIEKCVLAAD